MEQTNDSGQASRPAVEVEQSWISKKVGISILTAGGVLILFLLYFFVVGGKKPEKVYHVGVLSGVAFFDPSFDGFKEQMTKLGYVENKNIVYDVQRIDTVDLDKYKQMAQKLVEDKNDLLLTFPTEASLAAKEVTAGRVPVVFTVAGTEGNDLVESISHPGGNITGVHYPDVVDLSLLRLEIMHQLLPKAKRVVLFSFPNYPIVPRQVEALKSAAISYGIDFVDVPIKDLSNVKGEIEEWAKTTDPTKIDAILHIDGPTAVVPDAYAAIADFAEKYNIPVGGMPVPLPIQDKYQAVYYVLIDIVQTGRQAAVLADKILRGGVPAGTIPLPSAETYIDLNYPAAQKFGLTIPEDLLARANHITR